MNAPSPKLTREETAKIEIGQTAISRRCAGLLAVVFLTAIYLPPLWQIAHDQIEFARGQRLTRRPQCADLFFRLAPVKAALREHGAQLWRRIVKANGALLREMHAYEDELENQSLIGGRIRRPVQYVLSAYLGVGNEKSYCGRRPWLFYRPDVDHLILPGFLDPTRLAARRASGTEWRQAPQPDPIPAIARFRQQLAARGIELILVPTPVKPMLHAGDFGVRQPLPATPYNLSWSNFVRAVYLEANARVFDPAPILAAYRAEHKRDAFLKTDTHWTPEAMQRVAAELARNLRESHPTENPAQPTFTVRKEMVTGVGDLVTMLQLPERQNTFPPENCELRQILGPRGEAWRPDPSSDILLLGDSFSNIYSLDALGWSASAGFAEQLSYELGRSIDAIVINDNGAFATRAALARELRRGRDRLAGKKIVIWQFAVRELSEGDWREIPMELGMPASSQFVAPPPGQTWTVKAEVLAVAPVPLPGTVPYKDHIVAVHLGDIRRAEDAEPQGQALCYMFSMRDQKWTRAARLRPGEEIDLQLKSWSDLSAQYEGINRSELDDESLQWAEPCWGERLP
jgi:hypothetical protein